MTKEIRSVIDTEVVKGLLLINGGGSVALLAFLPTVIGKYEFYFLTEMIIYGLAFFLVGLVTAVYHTRLRRVCSVESDKAEKLYNEKGILPEPCKGFIYSLFDNKIIHLFPHDKMCVCRRCVFMMWASFWSFIGGGVCVLIGGYSVV